MSKSGAAAKVAADLSMKVEDWPLEKIIPYARNPRKNEGAAVSKVKASLHEFGVRQPIVVDKEGVIIAGHTRLMAAHELGMTTFPVHVAKDLTDAQAKAYRIADNRVGEESAWDFDLLEIELSELSSWECDLGVVGFDDNELRKLVAGDTDLGDIPDTSVTPDADTVHCPKCGTEFTPP